MSFSKIYHCFLLSIALSSIVFQLGCNTGVEDETSSWIPGTVVTPTKYMITNDETTSSENTVSDLESLLSTSFILMRGIPGIQVWQQGNSQKENILLYESAQSENVFEGILEDVVPKNELAIYERFEGEYPQTEVELVHLHDALSISVGSIAKKLAWAEEIGWCPSNVTCYGYHQIAVFDVDTKKKHIIAQFNFHSSLQDNEMIVIPPSTTRITRLDWSYDEQFLAITVDIDKGMETQLAIYDFENGTLLTQELGNLSGLPVWDNNRNYIAYGFVSQSPENVDQRSGIKVIELVSNNELKEISTINTSESFLVSSDLNWSSNGTEMVAVLNPGDQATGMNSLGIINIYTGRVQEVALKGFSTGLFSKPKWSPSGRYIGVNYRSDYKSYVNHLIIFDVTSGQVQAILELERPESSWTWTESEDVLIVDGREPTTSMHILLWPWQSGEDKLTPLFPRNELDNETVWESGYMSILD